MMVHVARFTRPLKASKARNLPQKLSKAPNQGCGLCSFRRQPRPKYAKTLQTPTWHALMTSKTPKSLKPSAAALEGFSIQAAMGPANLFVSAWKTYRHGRAEGEIAAAHPLPTPHKRGRRHLGDSPFF